PQRHVRRQCARLPDGSGNARHDGGARIPGRRRAARGGGGGPHPRGGARALERLAALTHDALGSHPLVERIVFRGLLGGITLKETGHPWFSWDHFGMDALRGRPGGGALIMHRMLRRKFLVQVCGHDWSTVRVEPPLIVSAEECRAFVSALAEELDWIRANG